MLLNVTGENVSLLDSFVIKKEKKLKNLKTHNFGGTKLAQHH